MKVKKIFKSLLLFLIITLVAYVIFVGGLTLPTFEKMTQASASIAYSTEDLKDEMTKKLFKNCLEHPQWSEDLDKQRPRDLNEFCLCFSSNWAHQARAIKTQDTNTVIQPNDLSSEQMVFTSGQRCRRHLKKQGTW